MQFLSFKLSFNDYYIQDISKKIKSVKKKKMYAGEYQVGIVPYGYKKDEKQKNHLIIDENVSYIVQEIFDMYANQGLSTLKIANELNKRGILYPRAYREMNETKNECIYKGRGWDRIKISKILDDEVYIGNVISGKTEKISPKMNKKQKKLKSEYIRVENTHEPIISKELWYKVQEKKASFSKDKKLKYEYPLKDLVYCGECGNKARFQHIKNKDKSGKIYLERNLAICSKKLDHMGICENKMMSEKILIKEVKKVIQKEIEELKYTSKELKSIYNKAKDKATFSNNEIIKNDLNKKIKELDKINDEIARLFEKKVMKSISIDNFKISYKEITIKKNRVQNEIDIIKEQIKNKSNNSKEKYKEFKKIAENFLKMENPNNEILKKLIKRIEFDKNRNIRIELNFSRN